LAGILFIISAPSGSGKSTLVNQLRSDVSGLDFSISYTTREPRGSEQQGREYHYIDRATFERMQRDNEFLESADVFGNFYGTARHALTDAAKHGNDLLLDIDVQGAAQVRRQMPDSVNIFVMPPTPEVLATRLRNRSRAEGSISGTHWTPNDVGEAAGDKDAAYAKYSALITKYYPKIKHSNWTKANYSGALLFVDAVKRLGANVTRKGLKDVMDATKVWDVGLGAKVEYWCNHRGNHSEYLVKLVKDPDAANSPDSRTRDAGKLGGGMRFKFLEGPYGDPVNHPDGTSDVAAFSKKCSS